MPALFLFSCLQPQVIAQSELPPVVAKTSSEEKVLLLADGTPMPYVSAVVEEGKLRIKSPYGSLLIPKDQLSDQARHDFFGEPLPAISVAPSPPSSQEQGNPNSKLSSSVPSAAEIARLILQADPKAFEARPRRSIPDFPAWHLQKKSLNSSGLPAPPPVGPSLSKLNYDPSLWNLNHFHQALRRELSLWVQNPGKYTGFFSSALTLAFQLDPAAAVALAEAQVRVVSPNDLPRALSQLALAYQVAGRHKDTQRLLDHNAQWIPSEQFGSFPSPLVQEWLETPKPSQASATPLSSSTLPKISPSTQDSALAQRDEARRALRRALLTNRYDSIPALLPEIRFDAKEQAELELLLQRQHLPLAKLLDSTQLGKLQTPGKLLAKHTFPLNPVHFSQSTTGELVELLGHHIESYGAQDVTAAALVTHLVCERGYVGTGISPHASMWAGIQTMQRQGNPSQAFVLFWFTQQNGLLHPEQNNAKMFACESGLYLGRILQDAAFPLRGPEYYPVFDAFLRRSENLAKEGWYDQILADKQAGRKSTVKPSHLAKYLWLISTLRWEYAMANGHTDQVLPEWEEFLKRPVLEAQRERSIQLLMDYHFKNPKGDPKEGQRIFREVLAKTWLDPATHLDALQRYIYWARVQPDRTELIWALGQFETLRLYIRGAVGDEIPEKGFWAVKWENIEGTERNLRYLLSFLNPPLPPEYTAPYPPQYANIPSSP
ncbi:MAG: hypothetical protein HC904_04520 [Blastochloris sp.]|nr:hypothetical protein [Blastochloris sp.]